jgi:hypothetical protein
MEQGSYGYDTFLSPFTWRYGSQGMRRVWSEEHKRRLWRRIWVALAEAEHEAGLVSQAELDDWKPQFAEPISSRLLETLNYARIVESSLPPNECEGTLRGITSLKTWRWFNNLH